jgi:intracellular multiplication protein IcmL
MKKFYILVFLFGVAFADMQKMVESQNTISTPASVSSPYEVPHVANPVVLSWMNESVVTTFSYDFANYNSSFQLASTYYTPSGWAEIDNRHKELHDLEQVIKNKLAMSAVATDTGKIVSQGVVNGVYTWLVEAPYLIVASDSSHNVRRSILVRALIVRSDPDVHYRGLAIDKIAVKYIVENKVADQTDPAGSQAR